MLRSILLHTNLSPEDNLVLRFAEGAPVLGVVRAVLSSVVDTTGLEGPVIVARVDRVRGQLLELARPLREAGLEVEVRVPTGETDRELLGLASETHVDLLASGTHGKSAVDRLVGGSVSESLLSEAERPTLFVRFELLETHEDPAGLARTFGSRLVMATDFSGPATRAFISVLELSPRAIGTLYLLHVMDPELEGERRRRHEVGAEFQLRSLADLAGDRGVTVVPVVRQGELPMAVLDELEEREATGCVVGTRGRGAIAEELLGSLALTLLRQAACPVLVVP